MLMTLWCTHHTTYFRLLVPWFRGLARHSAWTHDILYKVGDGIFLSKELVASGLDLNWWQIDVTSGEFQVFGGIFDAGLR
jgi:hypothetical protein